jgi:hypothetical protein
MPVLADVKSQMVAGSGGLPAGVAGDFPKKSFDGRPSRNGPHPRSDRTLESVATFHYPFCPAAALNFRSKARECVDKSCKPSHLQIARFSPSAFVVASLRQKERGRLETTLVAHPQIHFL